VIVSFLGRSELDIIFIIAVVAWPLLFRVVRASTIEYSQREYVLAAQALGSKPSRILRTLLLPDVIPSAITYGLVGVALAIVAEGALSFLGQSVPSPTPTWGNMIAAGSQNIQEDVTLLIVPAIAMFSFILPINYIGDRLRQVLDNRQGVL
jgi:peptide/nickel transport system permease protein